MKSKKKITKSVHKTRIILHSQKRAKERYGIWMSTDIYSIAHVLRSELETHNPNPNTVLFLYRENKTSSQYHYLITWRNNYYWIVWNDKLKTIHTFLPTNGLQNKISKLTNSVIAFLSTKGLIDIKLCHIFDVIRVRFNRPFFGKNLGKHPHSIHNQLRLQ